MTIARSTWFAAAALIAGGVLAALGTQDTAADFTSARELWSDLLRDADQAGLQFTRVSVESENRLGNELAAANAGSELASPDEAYVNAVVQKLAPHVRRKGIVYRAHLVNSPAVNAWALPGGHIYVTTGMLGFLETEAELASVTGHEMAHVDLRHCIEHHQYTLPVALPAKLARLAYQQFQELDADADGSRIAFEAGYDPAAAETVFTRLAQSTGEQPHNRARTPEGEAAMAAAGALGDFLRSHPASQDRAKRLHTLATARHGVLVYVGRDGYAKRSLDRDATDFRTL